VEYVLHLNYAISVQAQLSDLGIIVESLHLLYQIALQVDFVELVQWPKPLYLFEHVFGQDQLL
jgi:hypothetical protein